MTNQENSVEKWLEETSLTNYVKRKQQIEFLKMFKRRKELYNEMDEAVAYTQYYDYIKDSIKKIEDLQIMMNLETDEQLEKNSKKHLYLAIIAGIAVIFASAALATAPIMWVALYGAMTLVTGLSFSVNKRLILKGAENRNKNFISSIHGLETIQNEYRTTNLMAQQTLSNNAKELYELYPLIHNLWDKIVEDSRLNADEKEESSTKIYNYLDSIDFEIVDLPTKENELPNTVVLKKKR